MATKISLPQYTAYSRTGVYSLSDGSVVFGLQRVPLVQDNTDQVYVVTQATEDKLDKISEQFYGTSELAWAIAVLNNIVDLQTVPAGTQLRIPSQSRIPTL